MFELEVEQFGCKRKDRGGSKIRVSSAGPGDGLSQLGDRTDGSVKVIAEING